MKQRSAFVGPHDVAGCDHVSPHRVDEITAIGRIAQSELAVEREELKVIVVNAVARRRCGSVVTAAAEGVLSLHEARRQFGNALRDVSRGRRNAANHPVHEWLRHRGVRIFA